MIILPHQNPCCYKPCHNNEKCLLGYTEKNYACECQPGFTGEKCENGKDRLMSSSFFAALIPRNVQRLSVAATKLKKEREGSAKAEVILKMDFHVQVQKQLCSSLLVVLEIQ